MIVKLKVYSKPGKYFFHLRNEQIKVCDQSKWEKFILPTIFHEISPNTKESHERALYRPMQVFDKTKTVV